MTGVINMVLAVTQGWNGYYDKNQHRQLSLEKKILPPLMLEIEPETFWWKVQHSTTELYLCPLNNKETTGTQRGIPFDSVVYIWQMVDSQNHHSHFLISRNVDSLQAGLHGTVSGMVSEGHLWFCVSTLR